MRVLRLSLIAAVSALVVAGCAREPNPAPQRQPPAERPTRPPQTPAPSPAEFIARAASIDLFVIRSSELALTRAADPRLREFARLVVAAHKGTSAQLSFAGRRLNLLPSSTLLPEHQRALAGLQQSANFDRLYWRQQVAIHEIGIALHSNYAARGSSPTLKPVASAAVPIYRRHLQQLRALRP